MQTDLTVKRLGRGPQKTEVKVRGWCGNGSDGRGYCSSTRKSKCGMRKQRAVVNKEGEQCWVCKLWWDCKVRYNVKNKASAMRRGLCDV